MIYYLKILIQMTDFARGNFEYGNYLDSEYFKAGVPFETHK